MMSEGDLMSVYKNQSDDLVYIPVYLYNDLITMDSYYKSWEK